jgi:hypothetical protein
MLLASCDPHFEMGLFHFGGPVSTLVGAVWEILQHVIDITHGGGLQVQNEPTQTSGKLEFQHPFNKHTECNKLLYTIPCFVPSNMTCITSMGHRLAMDTPYFSKSENACSLSLIPYFVSTSLTFNHCSPGWGGIRSSREVGTVGRLHTLFPPAALQIFSKSPFFPLSLVLLNSDQLKLPVRISSAQKALRGQTVLLPGSACPAWLMSLAVSFVTSHHCTGCRRVTAPYPWPCMYLGVFPVGLKLRGDNKHRQSQVPCCSHNTSSQTPHCLAVP